ncbi:hypothetical protein BDZ97DRAFT_1922928 [Flammula alnicola]|nr:hypothetical protein BDZ97DRAFT_1922928 [Flammula alnicola]
MFGSELLLDPHETTKTSLETSLETLHAPQTDLGYPSTSLANAKLYEPSNTFVRKILTTLFRPSEYSLSRSPSPVDLAETSFVEDALPSPKSGETSPNDWLDSGSRLCCDGPVTPGQSPLELRGKIDDMTILADSRLKVVHMSILFAEAQLSCFAEFVCMASKTHVFGVKGDLPYTPLAMQRHYHKEHPVERTALMDMFDEDLRGLHESLRASGRWKFLTILCSIIFSN